MSDYHTAQSSYRIVSQGETGLTLSAVEEFSRAWDTGAQRGPNARYRRLMPASPPAPGQQYAFEVDLDRCSGCKACVVACHTLNGLDEQETWREVGLLVGGTQDSGFLQHVTTACHHCLDPACLTACPVNAYHKDPATGVVVHLDDQCIGCRYCTLACPYEVPKYHASLGIVRKCDMCRSRLAVGEPPACVQACPHEAIRIRTVNVADVVETHETHPFLPGTPDPKWTLPSTVYRTQRVWPSSVRPADYFRVRPVDAHWPLIVMLVLSQWAVGTLLVGLCAEWAWGPGEATLWNHARALWAVLLGGVGLAASTLHLGRPWLCYRAVLGLGHSWLSREIVALGAFAALAITDAWLGASGSTQSPGGRVGWGLWLDWATGAVGVLAIVCSAMVYAATRREYWRAGSTITRFIMSALVLGLATLWTLVEVGSFTADAARSAGAAIGRGSLVAALVLVMTGKLVFELSLLRHLRNVHQTPLRRAAQLHISQLANAWLARLVLGLVGGIVLPLLCQKTSLIDELGPWRWLPLCSLTLAIVAGELIERYLFFTAAVSPKMPGAIQ
jgi:formate dehydrogenase iron-sulfur subunit